MLKGDMKFREIFKSIKVILDLEAKDKTEAIKKIVGYLPINSDEKKEILFSAIISREKLGSTGIGHGIAVPHARSLIPRDLCVVVARLKNPIDFESLDNKPVRLIFLVVAPPIDFKNRYLITLGKIAEISRKIANDKRIFNIEKEEEFLRELERLLDKSK